MNNPSTCVYGAGSRGPANTCKRPRGQPCMCGLPNAERNSYTTKRLSAWVGTMSHVCDACGEDFRSEHAAAFHECHARATSGTTTGRMSSAAPHFEELPRAYSGGRSGGKPAPMLGHDYRHLEERVMLHVVNEPGNVSPQAWAALGRCPWDSWKPGRDVD